MLRAEIAKGKSRPIQGVVNIFRTTVEVHNTLHCSHCHLDVNNIPHSVEECQILKYLLLCFALDNSDDNAMLGMHFVFLYDFFLLASLKHSNCIVRLHGTADEHYSPLRTFDSLKMFWVILTLKYKFQKYLFSTP